MKSNIVTIRNYSLDIKIDGVKDRTAGFNTEHVYSVVFDNNKTPINYTEISWMYCDSREDFVEIFNGNNARHTVKSTYENYDGEILNTENELQLNLSVKGSVDKFTSITYYRPYVITMLNEPPVRLIPQYEITFNINENDVALTGGKEFLVSATINEVFGDEGFNLNLTVSGVGAAVIESNKNTALLIPVGVGSVVLFAKAESNSVGTITKSMTFNVIESTSENTVISIADGFVKTGSPLTASVTIAGYTKFLNYTPTWKVERTDDKGNTDSVDFSAENNSALLSETAKGNYTFSVLNSDKAVITSTTKKVADVDIEKVIIQVIPFIASIMVLGVIAVLLLKRRLSANKTVDGTLYKLSEKLSKQSLDIVAAKPYSPKKLRHEMRPVVSAISNILSRVGDLNNDTLGQYQTVYTTLQTAEKIAKASLNCANKIDQNQAASIFESLSKSYIGKAADICKALREAITNYVDSKNKSDVGVEVTNPNATVRPHRKSADEYLQMLTFYIHGDVDGNEDEEEN